MKQTISTIYPPPPPTPQKKNRKKTTKTHAKKHHKNEWVSTGLSSRSPTPHPSPPPAFLSSFLAMQHLKHLNCILLLGQWLPDIVSWLG